MSLRKIADEVNGKLAEHCKLNEFFKEIISSDKLIKEAMSGKVMYKILFTTVRESNVSKYYNWRRSDESLGVTSMIVIEDAYRTFRGQAIPENTDIFMVFRW